MLFRFTLCVVAILCSCLSKSALASSEILATNVTLQIRDVSVVQQSAGVLITCSAEVHNKTGSTLTLRTCSDSKLSGFDLRPLLVTADGKVLGGTRWNVSGRLAPVFGAAVTTKIKPGKTTELLKFGINKNIGSKGTHLQFQVWGTYSWSSAEIPLISNVCKVRLAVQPMKKKDTTTE